MENPIIISNINDFIFCPISIYYHQLYSDMDKMIYHEKSQIDGSFAHEKVDTAGYSSKKNILQGIDVYSDEYGILGKIDLFDSESGVLTERKNKIKKIFDGYIFQLYAQCISLREMGYRVTKLKLYSFSDNKSYDVSLPEDDLEMFEKFVNTIYEMRSANVSSFWPSNAEKCAHCIYRQFCDRSLFND